MAEERPSKIIDIWRQKNLWLAPDSASCFGIQLEGPMPPADEMTRRKQIVAERRKAWAPDSRAWQQLQEITNEIVRRHVVVKIWHPIIVAMDEDEGPYPIMGFCSSVETRLDETGVLQAYLRLEHPQVIPNRFGINPLEGREERAESDGEWINLGNLYEIQVVLDAHRDEAHEA